MRTTAIAVLVLLVAACRTADPGARPFAPPAVAATMQATDAPDYRGFAARELGDPAPAAFVQEANLLRDQDDYRRVVVDSARSIGPDMAIADFRTLLTDLYAAAAAITDERVRSAITARLQRGVDGLRDATTGNLVDLARAASIVMDDWIPTVADDGPPGCEVRGFLRDADGVLVPLHARTRPSPTGEPQPIHHYGYLGDADAWRVVVIADLLHRALEVNLGISSVAVALRQNRTAWENYLAGGYPQYPWENVANDWLVRSAWDRAPARQYVILHAEPGVLMDLGSAHSASVDAAVLLHGLGHLWYLGDDRSWFLGASATAAISSDEDNGLGYGITLHCGQATAGRSLPHVSIGLLWHEGEERDGLLLSIGVDLLRLLSPPQ